jgi:hypothetical protein
VGILSKNWVEKKGSISEQHPSINYNIWDAPFKNQIAKTIVRAVFIIMTVIAGLIALVAILVLVELFISFIEYMFS